LEIKQNIEGVNKLG